MIGFEILNLERQKYKKDLSIGNLITQGVIFKLVTFHKAIDGADYPDARSICEAAVVDGFEAFNKDCEMGGPADVAYHWGVMRILRKIASKAYPFQFAYFNQDDRLLPRYWNYEQLDCLIKKLDSFEDEFLFIQLFWNYVDSESITIDLAKIRECRNCLVYQGVHSPGDSGIIMSKAGAAYLMECFNQDKRWFEELIFERGNVLGCYSLWQPFLLHQSNVDPQNETWYSESKKDWSGRDRGSINSETPGASENSLRDIFLKHEVDKATFHHYTLFYELIISHLWSTFKRPITLLELGVEQGISMQAFSELPQIGKYIGVDTQPPALEEPEKATFHHLNAYDDSTVEALKFEGPYDLIIDDASHQEEDMCYFFEKYTTLCRPGGFLVYEDLDPSWESIHNLPEKGVKFFDCWLSRRLNVDEDADYIAGGMRPYSVIGIKQNV